MKRENISSQVYIMNTNTYFDRRNEGVWVRTF